MLSRDAVRAVEGVKLEVADLVLRVASEEEIAELADRVLEVGVVTPGTQPFGNPWHLGEPTEVRQGVVDRRAPILGEDGWVIHFVVFAAGVPVGIQTVRAEHFAEDRKTMTGSWLLRSAQGYGYAVPMRTAVLELSFQLGALRSQSGYLDGNAASAAVSRRCGYEPAEELDREIGGETRRVRRMVVSAERWALVRDQLPSVHIDGLGVAARAALAAT